MRVRGINDQVFVSVGARSAKTTFERGIHFGSFCFTAAAFLEMAGCQRWLNWPMANQFDQW